MIKAQNFESNFCYTITHWFQPIYNLKSNNIIGYEALLRDASPSKIPPDDIFREAEKNGYRNLLDLMSIKMALKTFLETFKDESIPLFLNIFPSTLLERDFLYWWDIHMSSQMPVVLELLENEPIGNWKDIKTVTRELQARGVKIAVDDMGAGYSFFQQWVELNPDFIKLDRYFAENLSVNSRKQQIVGSLMDLLSNSTEIIIEGIETEKDLDIAGLLGIPYAQGYFLGRPSPKETFFVNR